MRARLQPPSTQYSLRNVRAPTLCSPLAHVGKPCNYICKGNILLFPFTKRILGRSPIEKTQQHLGNLRLLESLAGAGNTYFNWQSLGIFYSHNKSGQPGPITRLLSCTPEQLKQYKDLEGIPTHYAPSWTVHPRTGDTYRCGAKMPAWLCWLSVGILNTEVYELF